MTTTADRYTLKVGQQGATRLQLVNQIYGPESERVLREAGLRFGARVADIGCGTGTMSLYMASVVGEAGSVTGIDINPAQIEQAQLLAKSQTVQRKLTFQVGGAYEPGLPEGAFDLVYSRLLLMHLDRPEDAIAAMSRLLAPGGTLVCEEASVDSTFCDPPCDSQPKLHAIASKMAAKRGCDFNIAHRLYHLISASGLGDVRVSAHQPLYVTGEQKLLEVLSFAETIEFVVSEGFCTREEFAAICDELRQCAHNDSVAYGLSRMIQVRATRT